MQRLWKLIHALIGHEMSQHEAYGWGGIYYCPKCDQWHEYYEDALGYIVDRAIIPPPYRRKEAKKNGKN